jgi:uncharacterized integral membrane protein (TIGR00697 family)
VKFETWKQNLGSISASLYVACQLLANVLSTKIVLLPGLGWATDGGTVIYPLTFTLRDFVHKTLGKAAARQIVVLAALVSAGAALLFLLVGKMAPDPAWGLQPAYESILLPIWRITFASIVAQVVSELVDTEIFSFAYRRFDDLKAALLSNFFALIVDSVIFSLIAFAGDLPAAVVGQIIVTNIVIKLIMSLVVAPGIKLIPRQVELVKI